jgi:enoyl-CoA hydratase
MGIELTFDNAVATVLINHAGTKNAITLSMWQELVSACDDIRFSKARLVVIRGADHCFSSGADIHELSELSTVRDAMVYWRSIKAAVNGIAHLDIPSIALIEGCCVGGALVLAVACDLRYVTSKSEFSLPIAKLGIILDRLNVARLITLVGRSNAKRMIFAGDTISGEHAYGIGLANEVVEADQFESLIQQQEKYICENDAYAIAHTKQQIRSIYGFWEPESDEEETEEDRLVAESLVAFKSKSVTN